MVNLDIRMKCKSNNIPLWKLADELGVSEPTFFRWLRYKLPPERKKQMLDAIEKLSRRR